MAIICFAKHRGLLIFVAILVILVVRSWESIALPDLESEDGKFMLAYYFNKPFMASITVPYNGYVSYFPNLLAWLTGKLPLLWVPTALTVESILLCAIGYYAVRHEGLSWLIPSQTHRDALAISLALLPIGRDPLVTSLTYSQWNLFVIAIFTAIRYPLCSDISGLLLWATWFFLTALSIPLSILLIPILLIQLLFSDGVRQRYIVSMAIIALLLYKFFWVEHAGRMDVSLSNLVFSIKVFFSRVVFEAAFGARATTILAANGATGYVSGFGVMLLSFLMFLIASGKSRRQNSLIALVAIYLALSIVVVSVLVRCRTIDDQIFWLTEPTLQRYFYVSKLILISLFFWQVSVLKDWKLRLGNPSGFAVIISITMYCIATIQSNLFLYANNESEGLRIRQLVTEASDEDGKRQKGLPYINNHRLDRGESWSFTLSLDDHAR